MDTNNIFYDELTRDIVQAHKKHFLDDLASPAFIREGVILEDTNKNPNLIVEANLAFAGASR